MKKITDNIYEIEYSIHTRFNILDWIIKRQSKWLPYKIFSRSEISTRISNDTVSSKVFFWNTMEEINKLEREEFDQQKKAFCILAWYGDWAWNVPEWFVYFTYTYDNRYDPNKKILSAIIGKNYYDQLKDWDYAILNHSIPFVADETLPYIKS